MKKYIPILGIFLAEYPIKNQFWVFFVYQVSLLGIITYLISYNLIYFFVYNGLYI